MLFSACGDLHLTHKCPKNRKDDYKETIMGKFEQLLQLAEKTDSKLLAISGDLFDSALEPYIVTGIILTIIKKYKVKIIAVVGQHDLRYHKSGVGNSPIGILVAGGVVKLLSNKKPLNINGTTFIGSGWNEEPKKHADVMLTHRMVTEFDPLWPGQTDYITGKGLLKRYKWAKCIISGDNHKPHSISFKGRVNINCGSMVRSNKRQIEHTPFIWYIDTDGWKVSKKKLNIIPPKDAFDFDKIEREEIIKDAREKSLLDSEKDIKKFIDSMPSDKKKKPEFKEILKIIVKNSKTKKDEIELINEIMEEVS